MTYIICDSRIYLVEGNKNEANAAQQPSPSKWGAKAQPPSVLRTFSTQQQLCFTHRALPILAFVSCRILLLRAAREARIL